MGKVRKVILGDEESEKELKRKADARRQTKAAKKSKDETKDESSVVSAEPTEKKEKGKKTKPTKTKVRSKRYQEIAGMVDKTKLYALGDAIALIKKTASTKFVGTVELHINLNPLSLGDKKDYRTGVSLPHGTGKEVKVAIADDKILEEIQDGKINFDILVAHPTMMPKLAKVAKILGPKGLMPNPKTGTVTPDPEKRAKELSSGQVNIKTEPNNPIIHMPIGKVSFEDKQLAENISAVFKTIGTNKISRATLSSTMGPGLKLAL